MQFQNSLYIYPLLLSSGITAALGLYAWRRRQVAPSAVPFASFMLAAAVWALGGALSWASTSFAWQSLFLRLTFLGVIALPVGWFTFAMLYTGRGRRLAGRQWVLWVVPVVNAIVMLTNPLHGLFWRSVQPIETGGFHYFDTLYGPWFWVHSAYSYVLMVGGTVLIFQALLRSPQSYRGQAGGLIWGVLTPLIVNALYLARIIDIPYLDPTPFTFTVSGAAFAWSLFRYKLLVLVPVAHEAVIQNLNEPVIVLDAMDVVVNLNPAAGRLLGREERELVGQPGERALAAWPAVVDHLRAGRDAEVEVALPAGGNARPYQLRLATLRNDDGAVIGRLLHLQDITVHKATEAALAQSEQNFYTIVESITDPYFEADLTGKMVYANRAFCESMGYSREEIVGRSFRHLTDRRFVKTVYEYFRLVYQSNPPQRPLEYVYRRKDGTLRMAEMAVSVIRVADGQPVGSRGILRDVTDRKLAERALERAKEAAEEASQAKSAFLANVSHELRTPLTSVLGFAKIIRKRLLEQIFPQVTAPDARTERAMRQVTDNLNIIVAESERLTHLINDVLDLSKIEAGKVEWNMQPVSMNGVVEQALQATASLFEAKGLKLYRDIEPDLPAIIGDRNRLIQVVINLISNAVKFTEIGHVQCSARRQGDEIVVSVRDTGIGIARDDFDKVFERFTQVGDTLTDKPQGSGLGLPICKQIVEHHGGRIWLDSVIGRGSSFFFSIPVGMAGVPAPEGEPLAAEGQAAPPAEAGGAA